MHWLISRCRPALLATAVLGCLLFAYCASYIALSRQGYYVPAFDRDHRKVSEWAPLGFMGTWEWRGPVVYFYYPLLRLDQRYWHKSIPVSPSLYRSGSPSHSVHFRSSSAYSSSNPLPASPGGVSSM
jgi:hypothetical protein